MRSACSSFGHHINPNGHGCCSGGLLVAVLPGVGPRVAPAIPHQQPGRCTCMHKDNPHDVCGWLIVKRGAGIVSTRDVDGMRTAAVPSTMRTCVQRALHKVT